MSESREAGGERLMALDKFVVHCYDLAEFVR